MHTIRRRKRFDIINYIPYVIGFIAVVLIIVLICVSSSGSIKEVKKNKLDLMPFSAESVFKPFAQGAVYVLEGNIYYVDDRNEIMWGFSGASDDMQLFTGATKIGVTLGKKLQLINKEGTLVFTKEFSKNISSVAIGEKLIAVSLSNSDDTIILNSTGEEIDRITSNVNSTNIRFGVYEDSSVWVITVENTGLNPTYQLSTYKYDSGKTQTVAFSDDSQMMYDSVFNNNIAYIFGTEKIMLRDCDYTGSVNKDYNVNGYDVIACAKVDKKVNMLLMNNGRIKAINEKGITDLECEEKVLFGAVYQKHYFAFSNYFMYKYKAKNSKVTKYKFPVRIDDIIHGEGYVLVCSGNEVYRYSLG
ncbi:MAG: hypothetical protein E7365_01360 [Clostridiales bacterium]|nr:hypothetical protein [Clostridiales bacterium]